jgi:hypothetical protein
MPAISSFGSDEAREICKMRFFIPCLCLFKQSWKNRRAYRPHPAGPARLITIRGLTGYGFYSLVSFSSGTRVLSSGAMPGILLSKSFLL